MTDRNDVDRVRELAVAVFRTNGVLLARGDRLVADLGLTSSLWQVLDALERAGAPATISQVARLMGLRRQSVQRTADLLADDGLVTYTDNPADKRAQLVSLTPRGREALAAIHLRERAAIDGVMARLAAADIAAAIRVLGTYADELARQLQADDPA